jgi:hypothetical protein
VPRGSRDAYAGVWTVALAAVAAALAGAQQSTASRREVDVDAVSLYVNPASLQLAARPELRAELLSGPHQYLRFVNRPFARAVCSVFRSHLAEMPRVALHGDAQLGQYAVTDAGRGLTGFEETSSGPALVDLVRLGVSVRLVSDQHGWRTDPARIVRQLFAGYRKGLSAPQADPDSPAAALRIEAGFRREDRASFLAWADSLTSPLAPDLRSELEESVRRYAGPLLAAEPGLDPAFFRVEAAGTIALGVGSALDEKYLIRVRGPGEGPDDDVVLEAREVRNPGDVDCVDPGSKADPFRMLLGRPGIAYRPWLGFFQLRRRPFWVHAWLANYVELDLETSIRNPAELAEIAFDSGAQLASAHFEGPEGETREARARQRALLDRDQARVEGVIRDLAEITTEAWRRFRAAAAREGVVARSPS